MKWNWPNVISLSRIPFGVGVAVAGANENWGLALFLLLVGAFTDYLDGYVARRTNSITDFGGNILDPIGDGVLTACTILGLYFANQVGLTFIIIVTVISLALQSLRLFGPFWFWLADNLLRAWYLGLVAWLFFWYAALAMTGASFAVFATVLAVFLLGLLYKRRQRIKEWLTLPA